MKKTIKAFSARAAMMLLATLMLTLTAQTAWAQDPLPLPTPDGEGNVTLERGDYIVNSNVTISGKITANDPVNLWITNGATLSVGGNIISNELHLTIFSGSKLSLESMVPINISMGIVDIQGGTISSQECSIAVNTLIMNGGTVNVKGIVFSSGTIQNATIEAYSVNMSFDATISGSTIVSNDMAANGVTFSGSDVTVSSKLSLFGAVVFDASSPGVRIAIGKYDNSFGGTLTITNGSLTDGQNIYTGTIDNPSDLNGKTLTYYNASSAITVSLNRQGGSGGTESVTPTAGSVMPDITPPTRTGYTFGGYYTDTNGGGAQIYKADGTSEYVCDFTGTVTLYAKWTAKTYTVTLDWQGGSGGPASVTATFGSAMPAITPPTRTYYEFDGYYTQENGGGVKYYNADGTSAGNWVIDDANTTLYAHWKKYLSNEDIKIEIPAQTYNGSMLEPVVTVKDNGSVVSNEHYSIIWPDGRTNVGDYTIHIEAKAGSTAYIGTIQATFTITPKAVTITAGSDSKTYDGTALTKNTYTNTDLAACDHIESVTVAGSQTDAGTSFNVPGAAVIKNSTDEDVTANYDITYANGTLTVNLKAVTITADSDSKTYDGTPLTNDSYTSTLLAAEDFIESVTVAGSQTIVGSSDNVPSDAVIKNSNGEDVTANYDITYANGTLTVNRMEVTITADSDMKEYDGTPLTNDSYTSTLLAEGDHIESVTVAGSQTDAGTSDNVPSAAIIKNSIDEDVTANYDITYVNGTLIVMSNEEILSIEIDDITYEWKSDTKTFKVARCNSTSSSLVIPGRIEYNHVWYDVTEIGEEAFMNNSNLTSIDISHDPCPIEIIGARAFKNCTNLPKIILPASLTTIEAEAFENSNLTEITIPYGVTSIEERAFADCSSLTSVTIPGSGVVLAENAFEDCNGDLIIYVPEDQVLSCRNRWPAYAEIIYAEGTIPIPYIAADGSKAYCTDYTVLNGSETSLGAGWYVVNSDISYEGGLTFNGGEDDVNLILCDGAEMHVNNAAIMLNSLYFNIYGQSESTGKLVVTNSSAAAIYADLLFYDGENVIYGDFTINGGVIEATGGQYGISTDGDLIINNGSVTATGDDNGIYASGCNVTINGGTINATGDNYGIGGGTITISSGTVNATGGNYNGIYAYQDLIINGGTIEAHGKSDGISCNEGNITISGGNVTADCTANNSSGIFCSEGDITISGGSVYATGKKAGIDADNNLIISDGYIEATGNDYGILASLDITISGGHVIADGSKNGIGLYCFSGGITISGGIIDANSKKTCIFAYSEIVISGGSVDATGSSCGISNYEGNITISGGSVTADGISLGDGHVYLGWVNASDRIYVSSFILGGNIFIADGQSFYNGEIIIPTGKVNDRSNLEERTLTPYGMTLAAKQVTVDERTDYWTTFYCGGAGFSFDEGENACAYTATVSGTEITLHKLGRVIPQGTAVIIVGEDASISMTVSDAAAENEVGNDLYGVDVATPLDDVKTSYGADAILVLANKNKGLGFYELATTNVPARKAFLAIDDPDPDPNAGARQFTMVFDDATGIHSIDNGQLIMDNEAGAWYSLDGRRLSGKPTQKGLYIHNGTKVTIK